MIVRKLQGFLVPRLLGHKLFPFLSIPSLRTLGGKQMVLEDLFGFPEIPKIQWDSFSGMSGNRGWNNCIF